MRGNCDADVDIRLGRVVQLGIKTAMGTSTEHPRSNLKETEITTRNAQAPMNYTAEDRFDAFARDQLHAEVDLKWLFAGQGRWIDVEQLHGDPNFASQIRETTMDSAVESNLDGVVGPVVRPQG